MSPDQWGEVGDVVVADLGTGQPELLNGFLHIDGVPVNDGIEGEAKRAKLLFLPLLKRASDFAAFAMMNAPAKAVTQFCVVELGQDAPAERRVVDIAQNVDCLDDPADFGECARQGGRLIPDLERPHDARRLEMSEFQRAGQADQIGPVISNQPRIDGTFAEAVEGAVIGFPVDPPQLGVTQVGQPWTELVAKQPEQAKHGIGIGRGVGHEFHRLQLGFLFEQKGEQHQAVTQRAWNHDAIQAAELVGQQIVPGYATGLAEIFWVRSGVDGTRRRGWHSPAWMALAGAVKRMPSADAMSPAPQTLTSGNAAW